MLSLDFSGVGSQSPLRLNIRPLTSLWTTLHLTLEYRLPSLIQVHVIIKKSKTNPFHQGVNLFLVKTDKELCPVAAMVLYLAPRDSRLGLLFILQDGSYLTRQKFTDLFRLALQEAGLDNAKYIAHNFRIGNVISAKDAGLTRCACDVEAATHTNRTCAHHRRNWHHSPNSCKLGQLMLQALSHTELAIGCIKMLTIFRSVLY